MATFSPGPLASRIDGSLGGVTFKTQNGAIVGQTRAVTPRRHTPGNATHTRHLQAAHGAWHDLSPTLKSGWDVLLASDPSVHLLGLPPNATAANIFFAWFIGFRHMNLLPPLDTVPDAPLCFPWAPEIRMYSSQLNEYWAGESKINPGYLYQADGLLPYALWFSWPDSPSYGPGRFWHKFAPRAGIPYNTGLFNLENLLYAIAGPPREFWNRPPGDYLERFMPWIRGYSHIPINVSSPYPATPFSLGVLNPQPWRTPTANVITADPWPAPYYYELVPKFPAPWFFTPAPDPWYHP